MPTISGIPYIDGGIFNFTDGGYVPPAWSGSEYNFGTGLTGYLNQIWTDSTYVYAATSEEFSVTDIYEEALVAYVREQGEFTSVWADDDTVFLGTHSGIRYIDKGNITGTPEAPVDLTSYLMDYNSPYGITNDDVRYLHGNGYFMMACTVAGVDVYWHGPTSYRSYTLASGVRKGFMTSTGQFYYTISGTQWSINRVDRPLMNWTEPDVSYITGSGIFPVGLVFNDIFVTEHDNNIIFIATTSGVYVLEEGTLEYKVFYTE